jgi:hypothetical protein
MMTFPGALYPPIGARYLLASYAHFPNDESLFSTNNKKVVTNQNDLRELLYYATTPLFLKKKLIYFKSMLLHEIDSFH